VLAVANDTFRNVSILPALAVNNTSTEIEPATPAYNALNAKASTFVRARSMLRVNDPDAAGREVEGVLARYPGQREALGLRAATGFTFSSNVENFF